MQQRRNDTEPVSFEAVEPPDVQDWVRINISTSCEWYHQQSAAFLGEEPPQNPTLIDNRSDAPTSSYRTSIKPDQHSHCQLDRFLTTSNPSRGSRQKDLLRAQLLEAQEALSKALCTMDSLAEEDISNARSDRLNGVSRLVEQEIEMLALHGKDVAARTPANGEAESIAEEGAVVDSISEVSDSSSNIPDVLGEFFEYAREANMLRERISECLHIAIEGSASEGMMDVEVSDQIQTNGKVDDSKIDFLRSALVVAQERMAAQREKCLSEGLDPEHLRYRRRSSSMA